MHILCGWTAMAEGAEENNGRNKCHWVARLPVTTYPPSRRMSRYLECKLDFFSHIAAGRTRTANDDPAMSRLFPGDSPWGRTHASTYDKTYPRVRFTADCRRCEWQTTRGPPRARGYTSFVRRQCRARRAVHLCPLSMHAARHSHRALGTPRTSV